MPRKPKALPDYFTPEEAAALVAAAPSYPVRMAMQIMLLPKVPRSKTRLPGVFRPGIIVVQWIMPRRIDRAKRHWAAGRGFKSRPLASERE